MIKCVFKRIRSKKGKLYQYCIKTRKIVQNDCYIGCGKKEYKKIKPIKKISSKKTSVSKNTYDTVFKRDKGKCKLCGNSKDLHLHHILGRGKNLTDNIENCIILCQNCHLNIVHKNNKKYRPILIDLIKKEE